MELNKTMLALGGSLALGLSGSVQADTTIESLQAQITELRAAQNATDLAVAHAEANNALIASALADDARTSHLAAMGADKALSVGGQIQMRYIWNSREVGTGAADQPDEIGFQVRRAKVKLKGEKNGIRYKLVFAASRNTGSIKLEEIAASYDLTDTLSVNVGRDKLPFSLEEKTSSKNQMAVERSRVNALFSVGRGEGIVLSYKKDNLHGAFAISDGANSGEGAAQDFQNNTSDVALTARVEYKFQGTWAQGKDQSAWTDNNQGASLIVGGAVHYQNTKTPSTSPILNDGQSFSYTVDAAYENNGLSLTGAFFGQVISDRTSGNADLNHYGATGQVAWFFVPNQKQLFVRVASYDVEGSGNNTIWTAGVNLYQHKHNAKLTADVVWATNQVMSYAGTGLVGSGGVSSGHGLLTDAAGKEDQTAVRVQYQLLF